MAGNLDSNQVISKVYDELNNRLRTDASISASTITVEVAVSNEDDTIQVFGNDGLNNQPLKTDTNGNLQIVKPAVAIADKTTHDYNVTNVTTSAYQQLIASMSGHARRLEVFDGSGKVLVLAFGAPGSEVDQFYIIPGGNGVVHYDVPSGTRVSVKAVSGDAICGDLVINLYNY